MWQIWQNADLVRVALLTVVIYSLGISLSWALWQIGAAVTTRIKNFFLLISILRTDVARLNQQMSRLVSKELQQKLREPYKHRDSYFEVSRVSIEPPPIPSQTSTNWNDDHRETETIHKDR